MPHTATADTEVNGYTIPKDAFVVANTFACHTSEKHWDDPDTFKPERWLDDQNKIIKHEAFMPFSIGRRVCLGESLAKTELFIFAVTFLQKFDFRVDSKCPPSLDHKPGLTTAPQPYELIANAI